MMIILSYPYFLFVLDSVTGHDQYRISYVSHDQEQIEDASYRIKITLGEFDLFVGPSAATYYYNCTYTYCVYGTIPVLERFDMCGRSRK